MIIATCGDGATNGSAFTTLALQNSGVPGGPHKIVTAAMGQQLPDKIKNLILGKKLVPIVVVFLQVC